MTGFCISRISKFDFTENLSDMKILKFSHCDDETYFIDELRHTNDITLAIEDRQTQHSFGDKTILIFKLFSKPIGNRT